MIIVEDNDIRGALYVMQCALTSLGDADLIEAAGVEFRQLEHLGLCCDSTDREIWRECQRVGALFITNDRSTADGNDSLAVVIKQEGHSQSLPVVTISKAARLRKDNDYAARCAYDLLDYAEGIENYLGSGRLFIPGR